MGCMRKDIVEAYSPRSLPHTELSLRRNLLVHKLTRGPRSANSPAHFSCTVPAIAIWADNEHFRHYTENLKSHLDTRDAPDIRNGHELSPSPTGHVPSPAHDFPAGNLIRRVGNPHG